VDVVGSLCLVMSWRVMLGWVVGEVVTPRAPVDSELFLRDAVAHPIKSHVNRTRPLLFDGVVDDAGRC